MAARKVAARERNRHADKVWNSGSGMGYKPTTASGREQIEILSGLLFRV